MNTEEMGTALRARAKDMGLNMVNVAERAKCSEQAAAMVLQGDPMAPVGALVAVCDSLGYVAVVVPRPLAPVLLAGSETTEPAVPTRVSEVLRRLKTRRSN